MSDRIGRLGHHARIILGARGRRVRTGPLYVQVGVVNPCNYRCQFCWDHPTYVSDDAPYPDPVADRYYREHPEIDRDKAHMSFEMFAELADDLHAIGTRKIKFIGRGEPFLHRRFMDMLAYAKGRGFRCSVTTNGSLLTEQIVEGLVDLGLDEMFVSINAGSAETYARIHQQARPDAFEQIRERLSLLARCKQRRGKGPNVHLSCVITSTNYHEMPDMVQLAHDVGAQRVAFTRVSVYKGTRFLMLDASQNTELLQTYLPRTEQIAEQLGVATNVAAFRGRPGQEQRSRHIHKDVPCYVGWYFAIILADGTVNPCCECLRTVGTLKTQRFREIWLGEPYCRFREEIINLPAAAGEIAGCRCYNCGMALHNLLLHRVLHPFSGLARREAGFGLRDLKRFVSG